MKVGIRVVFFFLLLIFSCIYVGKYYRKPTVPQTDSSLSKTEPSPLPKGVVTASVSPDTDICTKNIAKTLSEGFAHSATVTNAVEVPPCLDLFLQSLKNPDPEIRMKVALYLANIIPRLPEDGSYKRVEPPLIDALKDSDNNVRGLAAQTLGDGFTKGISSSEAVKALSDTAIIEQDPLAIEALISALEASKDHGAVDALLSLLTREDQTTRIKAMWALQYWNDSRIPKYLQKLKDENRPFGVNDPNGGIRGWAMGQFTQGLPKNKYSVLIEALNDSDPGARRNAAMALNYIEDAAMRREAVLKLEKLLTDPDKNVAISAASAIRANASYAKPGDAEYFIPLLIRHINIPELIVRASLLEGIGGFAWEPFYDPRAIAAIFKLVDDKEQQVSWRAQRKMDGLKVGMGDGSLEDNTAEIVAPMIEVLKDQEPIVRARAAEVLGDINAYRAVDPLIIASQDKSSTVRCAAYKALKKIKSDKGLERVKEMDKTGSPACAGR